ncbi:GNAT family N-acetyltransferase [Natribaculum luteum]|uniref:GNAT family N-acetyltransferase n=1 Tax=Natribaculum luteum TaxID=1586232 RepID=A0ABD5NV25_9EURY|nr:GNAT family N-acetyltransferase [Natribaculum luteum]
MHVETRPYDPDSDRTALWTLKRAFERGLGSATGGDEKERVYEEKLTDAYRERYLEWVDRCVAEQPTTVTVAEREGDLVGYIFVLPETLSMIWDAAVVNELFVVEEFRGTGVADDLMDAALEAAREQDLPLERIVLDVDRENDRARAFYQRYGFEHWGEMVARPLESATE